jgi:hypothetical protein
MRCPAVKRAPYLLMLVAGLILGLVITSVDLATGRHIPSHRRNSTAAFAPGYAPPAFTCEWVHRRGGENIHDYECSFRLQDLLERGGNPPPGQGWEGLAAPDRFRCAPDGSGTLDAAHYECSYRHRQGNRDRHTHNFKVDEIVSVSDRQDDEESEDIWYPPHKDNP